MPKSEYQCLLSMRNLGDYVNKWIAIVNGKIVAEGDNAQVVFKQAKEKYAEKEPLILKVPKDRVMLL